MAVLATQGQYHSATHENLLSYGSNHLGIVAEYDNDTVSVYGHQWL